MKSSSPAWLLERLAKYGYLGDDELATIAHLALELDSPLLLERAGRPVLHHRP